MVVVAFSSDRTGERKWHLALCTILSGVGYAISAAFPTNLPVAVLGLSLATMGILAIFPVFWTVPSTFLGGIAAGAYFTAALAEIFGGKEDRELAKVGYYIAFPLVLICGVLLIVDLGQPQRFWELLVMPSDASPIGWAPMFKAQSPIQIGSYALIGFGVFSFLSLLDVWVEEGRIKFAPLRQFYNAVPRKLYAALGVLFGWFLAGYTGVLVNITAQPMWAETNWVGALFIASAASTGAAAIALVMAIRNREQDADAEARLTRMDNTAIIIEIAMLVIVLATVFPIVVAMVMRPALYNGLRHFVFVVPPFAVLGGLAAAWLFAQLRAVDPGALRAGGKAVLGILVFIAGVAVPVIEMVRLHPYQYTALNWASGGVRMAHDKYMLDYWGLAFKQAAIELRASLKAGSDRAPARQGMHLTEEWGDGLGQPEARSHHAGASAEVWDRHPGHSLNATGRQGRVLAERGQRDTGRHQHDQTDSVEKLTGREARRAADCASHAHQEAEQHTKPPRRRGADQDRLHPRWRVLEPRCHEQIPELLALEYTEVLWREADRDLVVDHPLEHGSDHGERNPGRGS